ncbi:MAG: amidohydrolase family protein [Candidatus Thorarchaeota archaeon]|nr:amidohydrolase family protein [Candidatus Thorarchaeota archaeon]
MLIVRAVEDLPQYGMKKGQEIAFYVVDAHHHMGKEKSHRNTPSGAYDFYALLWFEMQRMAKEMLDRDELLLEPVRVEPPPAVARLFGSRDDWNAFNHGWLVDRTVVFPYSDDYARSGFPQNASFKVSNDRIAGWSTRAPNSARLIGFARVDPMDYKEGRPDLAVVELERAVKTLGLRGLKLHPLSQLFVDDLTSTPVKEVLLKAFELNIPVLFDTRNIRTVSKIVELTEALAGPAIDRSYSGVIVAHCGMSPGDPALYKYLGHPRVYGETSTLHGNDVPLLFKSARERIVSDGNRWSEKLIFGTDYTFLSVQAAQVVLFMLSRDFPGNLADIQRVLAGNILSLVRTPMKTDAGCTLKPRQLLLRRQSSSVLEALEREVFSLVSDGEWETSSLDFLIPPSGTWPEPRVEESGWFCGVDIESYVLTIVHRESRREVHLLFRQHPGDIVTLSVIGSRGEPTLCTTEHSTQRMNYELERTLSKNSRQIDSPDAVHAALKSLLP